MGDAEVGQGVGERLADSGGRGVEGRDALVRGVGPVAVVEGLPVEREAELAPVPVLGGVHKAGLGQALAVVAVGESVQVRKRRQGVGVFEGERGQGPRDGEGEAFGGCGFHGRGRRRWCAGGGVSVRGIRRTWCPAGGCRP